MAVTATHSKVKAYRLSSWLFSEKPWKPMEISHQHIIGLPESTTSFGSSFFMVGSQEVTTFTTMGANLHGHRRVSVAGPFFVLK